MLEGKYDADIFVDGSYDNNTKKYSYGMVVEDKNGVHAFRRAFQDEKSSMRNAAGEIAGATAAINYARDNGYKNIKLSYDYEGIGAWCRGDWKAKNPVTMAYKQLYNDALDKGLTIDFNYVPAHTGVERNEICDALAKSALGIKDTKTRQDKFKVYLDEAKPYISKDEMQLKKQRFSAVMADSTMTVSNRKGRDSNECSEYQ